MPKARKDVQVNLTMLKKLVDELEKNLAGTEAIRTEKTDDNVYDYVIEMSKCTGLAAGIVQEATLLIGDIQYAVKHNTSGVPKTEELSSLIAALKGTGQPGSN